MSINLERIKCGVAVVLAIHSHSIPRRIGKLCRSLEGLRRKIENHVNPADRAGKGVGAIR